MLDARADHLDGEGTHSEDEHLRSLPRSGDVIAGEAAADIVAVAVLAWVLDVARRAEAAAGAESDQLRADYKVARRLRDARRGDQPLLRRRTWRAPSRSRCCR